MVPTTLKRLFVCIVITACMFGLSGCGVKQSEYDAKVAEVKNQVEKSAKAAEKVSQLQKDIDAAKSVGEKLEQAKNDAEAKVKTLEQEKADLQKQIPKPAETKPEPPK